MIDVDQQTDSNSDTALTLAAAGGHDELVTLLLVKGSDIEHRDKKGRLWEILLVRNVHCSKHDGPWLVEFAIGLVNSFLNCPMGK